MRVSANLIGNIERKPVNSSKILQYIANRANKTTSKLSRVTGITKKVV